jgi:hypothetical protein
MPCLYDKKTSLVEDSGKFVRVISIGEVVAQ